MSDFVGFGPDLDTWVRRIAAAVVALLMLCSFGAGLWLGFWLWGG